MKTPPRATYRLQLRPGFGFDAVADLCGYLSALGVSHVYLSPHLQATHGSTHGYDVTDPGVVNEELGGADAHTRMLDALERHGLGAVIDIVPNHMAISTPRNRWWWDVLENGPASRYAGHFDVDWRGHEARLRNKVLIPVLGDHYGRVLSSGGLRIERCDAHFRLRAHGEHVLPLSPTSLRPLLRRAAMRADDETLDFLADALGDLSSPSVTEAAKVTRRQRDKRVLYELLATLLDARPAVAEAIDAVIADINADPDDLDALLDAQNYRIAYWKAARTDLDYRRFFDIHTLAGLRTERAEVFEDVHHLVLSWIDAGRVQGLRVDHPDGLRDPAAYLRQLRGRAKDAWIVVEKILAPDETLPDDWPVDGTTGYDFLHVVTQLFIDPSAEPTLTETYERFCGAPRRPFEQLVHAKKQLVLDELLASDLSRLTALLLDVCEGRPRFRDYSRPELRASLREVLTSLPVYRTYVTDEGHATAADRARISAAVADVKTGDATVDEALLGLLEGILLGDINGPLEAELRARFQQLSGPAMAKGAEDTAFYCDHLLIARNEVGGEPGMFGLAPQAFHAHCERIAKTFPATMVTTSTHDTKRSEDVRARLVVLSEMPARWAAEVARWEGLAAALPGRTRERDEAVDGPTRYLLYQTLLGTWPIDSQRLRTYLEKAVREAKLHTSWLDPNAHYERAILSLADELLQDAAFSQAITAFASELEPAARRVSLAQLALKLTVPGVPDIYQGNEAFRFDLTDPDNRRPPEFAALADKLERARALSGLSALLASDPDLAKLFVTQRLLHLRAREPAAFGPDADYVPLWPGGEHADRLVAFGRGGMRVVVAVPRLTLALGEDLGDTTLALPPCSYEDVFSERTVSGGTVRTAELFAGAPLAVLVAT